MALPGPAKIWHSGFTEAPMWDQDFERYGISRHEWTSIMTEIGNLYNRANGGVLTTCLLALLSCGIYPIVKAKRVEKTMTNRLDNMNDVWNPRELGFTLEFIPYKGNFCTIKTL